MTQVRSFSRFILLAALLMLAGQLVSVSAADMLVLMNASGKVERYDLATGAHVGTVISGLPSSNEILFDTEGRLLISTGVPGGGTTMRAFTSPAMPQRSNNFSKYTPLGPVE